MGKLCVATLGCAVLALGCGGGNQLNVAPVHGTVTLDGQPLTSGIVTVWPSAGRAANGQLRTDGTFELTTYVQGDGAQLGTHPVTVTRAAPRHEQELSADELNAVPAKYSSPETSGLSITVSADQENSPVLELLRK